MTGFGRDMYEQIQSEELDPLLRIYQTEDSQMGNSYKREKTKINTNTRQQKATKIGVGIFMPHS